MRRHGGGLGRIRRAAVTAGLLSAVSPAALMIATAARAETSGALSHSPFELALLAAMTGTVAFAFVCAFALIRGRRQHAEELTRVRSERAVLRRDIDRAETLLNASDHRLVVYDDADSEPRVMGHLGEAQGVPSGQRAFLAFGQWLDRESAMRIERAITGLRRNAADFTELLKTANGEHLEATGHVAGAHAFVRFRGLSGEREDYSRMRDAYTELQARSESMLQLLSALPRPVWIRTPKGRLSWVNQAYARAVGCADRDRVYSEQIELLDAAGRKEIARLAGNGLASVERLPVVVEGERRVFSVDKVSGDYGSAAVAVDVSALDDAQTTLRRTVEFHAHTLDQLATAVAIFGPDRRLNFYNEAYRGLWDLDPAFLEQMPEDSAILDRLRAARKLPEQADFRSWKAAQMEAYRSVGAKEQWWHLPDGQTLRMIANPHPQGGVTYVYENVTERIELKTQVEALSRVQGETLDTLSDAVAVFGSDGRLRLSNPAFSNMWKLAKSRIENRPHIAEIVEWCAMVQPDETVWPALSAAVTSLSDEHRQIRGRMERRDGAVIDYATIPLPDGAILLTFVDITDTIKAERALVEKNEALQQADQLKNAFIQHVSYELRSPLTNIIGFAQLLNEPNVGDLNDKQGEYIDYILSSSSALLAIINDILDLATVDAGIMELDLAEVDVSETVAAAVEGVRDRLDEARIALVTDIPETIGSFVADKRRLRQVLFNLLSNAIAHSPDGGDIEIRCERQKDEIRFTVTDHGRGIPKDRVKSVFDRFVTHADNGDRKGAGLGLSIVKSLVELHGGNVRIESEEGSGTSVVCTFPGNPDSATEAA